MVKEPSEVNAPRGRRLPVMGDVARLAGVSHMTVSRVLNEPESVRPKTRERVLLAIEQLGYRRNSAARSLVTRRSQTLGVVCFDTTLYGPASMLNGIEHAAEDAGYAVSVASLRRPTAEAATQAVQRLVGQSVDGLVLIAPQAAEAMAFVRALPTDVPVVAVENALPNVTSVSVDQVLGARMLTEHLLSLGHETVHHVRGPSDWSEANGRVDGWLAALEENGRTVPRELVGDWSAKSGYVAGQKLARDRRATAVFAANDSMALGVLRGLHEAGVRVPEDVSVVGFDDIPEAAFMTPPLTTVSQPFRDVGRRSIEILLSEIEGGEEPGASSLIPPELVVRNSTSHRRR
ncbi:MULTISPECIES: LacI family DNA-binding transcriptional regulator [unclassified Micromonospora]|uniref:LacI family DNA-binding transcriptional regulator n=1 Tax=unclassified Micromonospora TaxID=2617518 RepID=UPI00340D1503